MWEWQIFWASSCWLSSRYAYDVLFSCHAHSTHLFLGFHFHPLSLSPSFVRLEPINLKKKKNRGRESWPFLCPVTVWQSVTRKRVWYLEERDRSQIRGAGWVQARSWKANEVHWINYKGWKKIIIIIITHENWDVHMCVGIFRIAWRCRVKKRIELIRGEWHAPPPISFSCKDTANLCRSITLT